MVNTSEEKLMIKLKEGDLQAAGQLFELYNKRLYNYFLKMTFDREVSADLTQNVFLRMLKYRVSFRGDKPFKSWIFQIARNAMNDHFRKEKKYSDYVDIDSVAESVGDDESKEGQYQTLYRSMAKLDPETRELLVMSKFRKMKYEEIGDVLDLTVSNVKIKVHRAIKKLRDHYYELEKI